MKILFKILISGFTLFMISFFVFLYQVDKVPEEEWIQHEAIVKNYYLALAELHRQATSGIAPSSKMIECPTGVFDQQKSLSALYGPYLYRFSTEDDKEWSKEYADWSWLMPQIFLEETDHFNKFASTSISKAVNSLSPLVAVFQPEDEELNYLPHAPNLEKLPTMEEFLSPTTRTLLRNKEANLFIDGLKTFATGQFTGWIIIVDRRANKLVCRGKLSISSGERVDYIYRHRSRGYSPSAAIGDDFVKQFHKEIAAILPEGLTVKMSRPKIPVAY